MSLREHWTIDPDVRFLNHGSFGACPRVVLDAQNEYRAQLEREPISFFVRDLEPLLDEVRSSLGDLLGAAPEDLVFVPNATTGVNAVLRSMQIEPGQEIVVTSHGYNACNNAAEFVTERAGARVVYAEIPFPVDSTEQVVDAVASHLSDKTRLLLIDHITSPTGLVLPLERIIAKARERGVAVLVDGAHAPGMLELDLRSLGADYYTGNCHKWLCAPKGAAFLWVRRELQASVRPVVISHGANSKRTDRSLYLQEFDWVGTDDPTPALCVPHALRFLESLFDGGLPAMRARNRALALEARGIVLNALGATQSSPEEMIGQLVSVEVPDGDTPKESAFSIDPLQQQLFDEYRIEVPVHMFPAPPRRLLRFSVAPYNEREEYVDLADALQRLTSG